MKQGGDIVTIYHSYPNLHNLAASGANINQNGGATDCPTQFIVSQHYKYTIVFNNPHPQPRTFNINSLDVDRNASP
jgi:hypothetical protein